DLVVVRSGVEAGDAICNRIFRSQQKDRRREPTAPDPSADVEPVEPRHCNVENDEVGHSPLHDGKSGTAVAGRLNAVALGPECPHEHAPDRRIVVYYEDRLAHAATV